MFEVGHNDIGLELAKVPLQRIDSIHATHQLGYRTIRDDRLQAGTTNCGRR
jgi:hypothetical protein